MSTVSYMLITSPSSSTTGTALIPRSENMCTTSKTEVERVAVARGKYLSAFPSSRPPLPFPLPPPSREMERDRLRMRSIVRSEGVREGGAVSEERGGRLMGEVRGDGFEEVVGEERDEERAMGSYHDT
jgi:hypothetical protein